MAIVNQYLWLRQLPWGLPARLSFTTVRPGKRLPRPKWLVAPLSMLLLLSQTFIIVTYNSICSLYWYNQFCKSRMYFCLPLRFSILTISLQVENQNIWIGFQTSPAVFARHLRESLPPLLIWLPVSHRGEKLKCHTLCINHVTDICPQTFLKEMGKVHLSLNLDAPLIKQGLLNQTNVTEALISCPGEAT